MLTRSQKLREKLGHKVICDYCGQKSIFNDYSWRNSRDGTVCPKDIPEALKTRVLINI